MKAGRLIVLGLALVGIVYVSTAWLPGCAQDLADGPFRKRFTHRPPRQAFEFVFDQPPLNGVSELRAAGETWLAGTNVWLRFRADPQTLALLTAGWKNTPATPASLENMKIWDSHLSRYDPNERLGWRTLYRTRKTVEYYKDDGYGGSVTAWVEPSTGEVFVFKFGI